MRKIWFSRHGESEYNMFAKIGGDSNISPQGQIYAKMLPDLLVDRVPLVCLCTSPAFRFSGHNVTELYKGVLLITLLHTACYQHPAAVAH